MLDPKTLLPELQKMLPQYTPQQLMEGMKEFEQAHPNLNNAQALQAVQAAMPKQAPAAPQGQPFQGLINQLQSGAK